MSVSQVALERNRNAKLIILGVLLTAAIFVIGLFVVKWSPYWHKAQVAAVAHSIGKPLVNGQATIGLEAGLRYTLAYFKSVWQAVFLALVLGASIQAFVPRWLLLRVLGGATHRSAAVATAASMTTMMCTCCTGPIVVGMRRQNVSAGSALAFFVGNPVLNPATLVFIGFVLGWQFAILRIGLGIALVFGIAVMANRIAGGAAQMPEMMTPLPESQPNTLGSLLKAWFRELWIEVYTILPGYVAIVFIVGALQAWLLPPGLMLHASGVLAVVTLSLLGTIFVIPTAGEVPIIQAFTHAGMGAGPAAALLMTLPAISAPSLFIVRKVFSARILEMTVAAVFITGIVAGAIAMQFVH